ncbi:MAG: hypothetical protein QOF51_3481 [Chloroflexota bacterium]|jgi:predicted transcriptional regulator|nr:hypothetical protein [Chloroflexota bacterium]
MVSQRLEVRLDEDHQKKLTQLVEWSKEPVAEIVREAIDDAYEKASYERRRAAVERLIRMESPGDALDPDELNRELDEMHDIPDLY